MTIATVRRLAADILGVGERRVWIDPTNLEEAKRMTTRTDVRDLIKKGSVKKLPVAGRKKVKKAKRRQAGSKKGNVANVRKDAWMAKVRSQRKLLVTMLTDEALPPAEKRGVYNKIKSGLFRSKRAMLTYLKESKLVASDYEPKKPERKKKVKPVKKAPAKKAEKKEGEKK